MAYNAVEVPYEITFLGRTNVPPSVLILDNIADVVFVLDLVLHFFKSFENGRGSITKTRGDNKSSLGGNKAGCLLLADCWYLTILCIFLQAK